MGYEDGASYVFWSAPGRRPLGLVDSGHQRTQRMGPRGRRDLTGALWVAWDSYRHGNYDIYLQDLCRR
ncbi:MAG: hypothetical protein R2724_07115 [Bryobacterales bacterium]